jgi:hypothetical protein
MVLVENILDERGTGYLCGKLSKFLAFDVVVGDASVVQVCAFQTVSSQGQEHPQVVPQAGEKVATTDIRE